MNSCYLEKIFINKAFENGIQSYIKNSEGKPFNKMYTFEMNVIKTLIIIYGEKSILLPYKIDNERAFKCNLLTFDLKENEMNDFIKLMNDYYLFLESFKSEKRASGIITEIEKILIKMINKRNIKKSFSNEEIQKFDEVFNPINGDLLQIKRMVNLDNGLIKKYWINTKNELTDTQIRMSAVNPNLLDASEYQKCGYDIRTIACLTEEEILKINNTINESNNYVYGKVKDSFGFNKFKLSTGNGVVDKLLLMGIIATGLMFGLIVLL